jgi:hypothetical protein
MTAGGVTAVLTDTPLPLPPVTCGRCRRLIGAAEPVWRLPNGWGQWAHCRMCAPRPEDPSYWYPPRPCQTCQRLVYEPRLSRTGRPRSPHRWAACCEACENRARARHRRATAPTQLCTVCGRAFPATRGGAQTCSPACRQRAYRARQSSVVARPDGE